MASQSYDDFRAGLGLPPGAGSAGPIAMPTDEAADSLAAVAGAMLVKSETEELAPGVGSIVSSDVARSIAAKEPTGEVAKLLREGAAAAAPLLKRRVVLVGLSAKPELNGRRGKAVSYNPSSGRYGVRLDGARSDPINGAERIALRPANLQQEEEEVAPDPPSRPDPPPQEPLPRSSASSGSATGGGGGGELDELDGLDEETLAPGGGRDVTKSPQHHKVHLDNFVDDEEEDEEGGGASGVDSDDGGGAAAAGLASAFAAVAAPGGASDEVAPFALESDLDDERARQACEASLGSASEASAAS